MTIHAVQFCAWLFPVWLLLVIWNSKKDWPENYNDVKAAVIAAAFLDFCVFCAINAIYWVEK